MKKRILFVAKDQALWNEFKAHTPAVEREWTAQNRPARPGGAGPGAPVQLRGGGGRRVVPDMNGLELLDQFMQRQPSAHRFVLSDVPTRKTRSSAWASRTITC